MVRLLHPLPTPLPETLEVDGERFHYLVHVLRLAVGDSLELFDGEGHGAEALVTHVGSSALSLQPGPVRETRATAPVHILQGLPKGDKLEWVLQKGTELGAASFRPVLTERCVARPDPAKTEPRVRRWRKIVEEASRQCGRADVPDVHSPTSLPDAVAALEPDTRLLILDEEARAVRLSEALAHIPDAPVALLVGPEGGLSRKELEPLLSNGARSVTLGPLVLRTETAALAALAVIGHARGTLG